MDIGKGSCETASTVYKVDLGELKEGDAIGW